MASVSGSSATRVRISNGCPGATPLRPRAVARRRCGRRAESQPRLRPAVHRGVHRAGAQRRAHRVVARPRLAITTCRPDPPHCHRRDSTGRGPRCVGADGRHAMKLRPRPSSCRPPEMRPAAVRRRTAWRVPVPRPRAPLLGHHRPPVRRGPGTARRRCVRAGAPRRSRSSLQRPRRGARVL